MPAVLQQSCCVYPWTQGSDDQMKVEWTIRENRDAAAVIPTMDAQQQRVQSLIRELDTNGVDSLVVVDSGPDFRFSRSMNAGIRELLSEPRVKYILLSNDDVYDISSAFNGMIRALKDGNADYVTPYVNGGRPSRMFTRSVAKLVFSFGLRYHAPMHALRVFRAVKAHANGAKPLFTAPPISIRNEVISVQPFSLFKREVLEEEMFDENFQNGVEDEELMYRLSVKGYMGHTNAAWNIHHVGGASFRTLHAKMEVGSYYGSVEQFCSNMGYFGAKYR